MPNSYATYFDRNHVMLVVRGLRIISWIVAVYFLFQFGLTLLSVYQYGLPVPIDGGPTSYVQALVGIFYGSMPGLIFFVLLQACAHGLLIYLDIERNSRNA
jgi:hypothetical protein